MVGSTTLQTNGNPISFSQIRKMYAGTTGSGNMSYYYKGKENEIAGGVHIYPVVPDTPSTNSIPVDGNPISFSQFYGTQKEYNVTNNSENTAKVNHKSLFDNKFSITGDTTKIQVHGYNDYGYFSRYTNEGNLYSDSTTSPALEIGAHPSTSTIRVDNNGGIYGMGGAGGTGGTSGGGAGSGGSAGGGASSETTGGAGGAASAGSAGGVGTVGSAGGLALSANTSTGYVIISNVGIIKGGGGGGGGGGKGGGGGGSGGGGGGGKGARRWNYYRCGRANNANYVEKVEGDCVAPTYTRVVWDGVQRQYFNNYRNPNPPWYAGNLFDSSRDYYVVRYDYGCQESGGNTGGNGGSGGAGRNGGAGGNGGDGGIGGHFDPTTGSVVVGTGATGGTGGSATSGASGAGGANGSSGTYSNAGKGGTGGSSGTSGAGGTGGTGGNGGDPGVAGSSSSAGNSGSAGGNGNTGGTGGNSSRGQTTGRTGGGGGGAGKSGGSGGALKTGGAPGNSITYKPSSGSQVYYELIDTGTILPLPLAL